MIVNPRITNPSIPKDSDTIEIAAAGSILLIPEAMKWVLQALDPARFLLTLGHSGSPCLCLRPVLTEPVAKGKTETANDWWRRVMVSDSLAPGQVAG
jgi:hypothetical protein